jgi:hypothetical protein
VATYLTGSELAQRVLGSVVIIDRPNSQEHGVGLVVGSEQGGLIAVTAAHVVREESAGIAFGSDGGRDGALATSVRVGFCDPSLSGIKVSGTPLAVASQKLQDIALIKLPLVPGFNPDTKIGADIGSLVQGDEAWVAGREGTCAIGGSLGQENDSAQRASIDDAGRGESAIRAHLPGSFPGTSGAALLTGKGVVGIVQSLAGGGNLVSAADLASIRSALDSTLPMVWQLRSSENLPPSLPEAAQRELSDALTRYVFDAQTSHLVLSGFTLNKGELSSAVSSYNTAISRYIEVKRKHDGALERYWGSDLLADYQSVRSELMNVHETFLDMSVKGYVNEMYRTSVVPAQVRSAMADMDEPLKKLRTDADRVVGLLAAKPLDRNRTSR